MNPQFIIAIEIIYTPIHRESYSFLLKAYPPFNNSSLPWYTSREQMTPYSINNNSATRSDSAEDAPTIERIVTTDQYNISVQGSDHAVDMEFLIIRVRPAETVLAYFLSSYSIYLHLYGCHYWELNI